MLSFPSVPLQPERLQNLRWSFADPYGFARQRLTVPLIQTEVLRVAREYPLALTVENGAWRPVAYLGDYAGETNRYVGEDGRWSARYVPFWLRVYPFTQEGAETRVFLDPSFVGVAGAHAFTDDSGTLTQAAQDVSAQLQSVGQGDHALREASDALVAEGVAQSRTGDVDLTRAGLKFVSAQNPVEIVGAKAGEWYARMPKALELAIAAGFSSVFLPRAATATVMLHTPPPTPEVHPAAIKPLYVPAAAPMNLDWLDMNEKISF